MSFRELRSFTEIMRTLGYPRLISVENFRTPNFALVADVLFWLVHKYDPHARVTDDIETELDRIEFLTAVAQVMSTKARIKLNLKKLYAADGHAVKELLKVATVLHSALRRAEASEDAEPSEGGAVQINPSETKLARQLATDITERGAKLYDLLGREDELRKAREEALRFLDASAGSLGQTSEQDHIAASIRAIVQAAEANLAALGKQCSDLEADDKALRAKIKKKSAEVERGEKRLKSLQTVRPAFMDEYEKLEVELQRQYELYLERFRNLDYLEHELGKYDQEEREKAEEAERALRRMQDRWRKQEEALNRGVQDLEGADPLAVPRRQERAAARPAAAYARHRVEAGAGAGAGAGAHVVGSMRGGDEEEEEEESGSALESESEEEASGSEGDDSELTGESEEGESEDEEQESGSDQGSFDEGDEDLGSDYSDSGNNF